MSKDTFRVTYYGEHGLLLNHRMVTCDSHWDACEFGWKHIPKTAVDFQVQEETFGAAPGPMTDSDILKALDVLASRVKQGLPTTS